MTSTRPDLEKAVSVLEQGGLVGMPTETVYGLAGDARNPKAVASIFQLKNRPSFNPLIAHVSDMDMARTQADFSATAEKLAERFWPGPLTLVLPVSRTNTICDLARAGLDTQAIRFPSHPVARHLIEEFGRPVVAPSANKSGRISPTRRDHVIAEFGLELPLVLDGGPSVLGIESTVLHVDDEKVTLLRAGTITRDDIETLTGKLLEAVSDNHAPRSPGMLSRHYAPDASLRLNVIDPLPEEAVLGFGPLQNATLNLSQSGSLQEAAANLYDMLRRLDDQFEAIAVSPIPETGIGLAINDRLRRAAQKPDKDR